MFALIYFGIGLLVFILAWVFDPLEFRGELRSAIESGDKEDFFMLGFMFSLVYLLVVVAWPVVLLCGLIYLVVGRWFDGQHAKYHGDSR